MKLYNIIKKPWPYWIGGIILALLNILLLATTGSSWKVTTGFLFWGAGVLEKIGFNISHWHYFNAYDNGVKESYSYFNNSYTIINIAVIVGALLAVLWASEFKWKRIKNIKQLLFALLGGILMGYGTRLSFGCNIGAYFSAIPSFSLHGWVFALFMFVGAFFGCKILYKYLL